MSNWDALLGAVQASGELLTIFPADCHDLAHGDRETNLGEIMPRSTKYSTRNGSKYVWFFRKP